VNIAKEKSLQVNASVEYVENVRIWKKKVLDIFTFMWYNVYNEKTLDAKSGRFAEKRHTSGVYP
jgi:hypothetical protein